MTPTRFNLTGAIIESLMMIFFLLGGSKKKDQNFCVMSEFSICNNMWQIPNKSQGYHNVDMSLKSKALSM